MNRVFKFLKYLFLVPVAILAMYIAFLWITYIDKTIVSGSKYGFTIGETKKDVYEIITLQHDSYPNLYFHVQTGGRAKDYIEAPIEFVKFGDIKNFERWELQFDGKHEYFNVLRLTFSGNSLVEIHRHRKYFELP